MSDNISPYIYAGLTEGVSLPDKEEKIINLVCRNYGITREMITTHTRITLIRGARQVAMYLLKEKVPKISLARIGHLLGGYDHTTVIHSIRVVEDEITVNPILKQTVQTLIDII